MEHLPVEIIGDILSHLGTARDVVGLSATCRKWREAYKKYLHTLSFKFGDWPRDITARQLEILITQTISQTVGLQCLSIHMGSAHEFAAVPVIAWLMYTRKTLQSLSYNGHTIPNVNVPEQCSRHKLQALDLDHHSIIRVEPTYLRFTCLKSLSLRHVIISALDLSILFTVCPRIESLTLDVVEIVTSDSQSSMELSSPTLKCIFVETVSVEKIILEADNLESLQNVNVLELGWTIISENFRLWVFGMIGRCPNLKKLVIHGVLSGMETDEQSQMVTNVTSSVLHLMRKYIHVDVRFVYD
ncbi:F-box/LRR-repeat protein At1g67190-like [Zingiber officinale]|uniref:F-box/LRR-repeat protein At1g67190-like n=1 Tax=Zingiber officinale TaxID=94328 RepID=UPI001C4CD7CC|nr:F-box/LRR-repeat protein At1g67190-like [Zingiber officinale]